MVVRQAGDHPEDVAVHRRFRLGKGGGGNGGGGVIPNAGKSQQAVVALGEAAAIRDAFRRLLEIPGPAVVAQALPEL